MVVNDCQQKIGPLAGFDCEPTYKQSIVGFVVSAVHAAGKLECTFNKMISQAKHNYTAGHIWPAGLSLTHVYYRI